MLPHFALHPTLCGTHWITNLRCWSVPSSSTTARMKWVSQTSLPFLREVEHAWQAENVDRFIRQAKKYLYLEKLTPTILNDMVNAVYVHAPDKSSGHRVQDVTISYNYIGILPANLLYDVMNGKAA